MSPQVNVLIVDDSALVRQVLTSVLDADPGIHVMGAAADPIYAMKRMNAEWPDVVVLDVEMPRMDGITFLKKLMAVKPTPVVICSTLTTRGAQTTMEAMASGAFAFVTKPTAGLKQFLEQDGNDIAHVVKQAAAGNMARMRAISSTLSQMPGQRRPEQAMAEAPAHSARTYMGVTTDRVVAVGTSTGGTQALEAVFTNMPRVPVGIVVVQHMPEKFTAAFASRLDGVCQSEVIEGSDGDRVLPGRIIIAPGGRHMSLVRDGAQYRVKVADGPPVNRHKPSVDVLFRSVAQFAGPNAMGVIMTGMGDDGARGLKEMRDAGAQTVGQDEATCVIYGMPAEAVRMGGVATEMPLQSIPGAIAGFANRK
ncbi:chemotaxis response regulator protein-glutamate methylesterase [Kineosporia sp. A_224]|uniref:protein-glutamate methylesterase/protein-glutamine glutaminase n=1 Tax=Kineosporia sp. A_224 TaxID=1962180 RepID=UPI000B4B99C0|nr:chemotaxis response regulator protein-glutamate methylesterase [Kineosporia sp. A_224]